jgi:hypothetical protein
MTQISFPRANATEAVTDFLDGDRANDGRRITRNLLDDNQDCVAVILDPARHRELLDAEESWENSQEPQDYADLPAGYRPYIHSPNATTDRLLPTEPLNTPLAHAIFGKPYDELDDKQQTKILGTAISCLLRTTLDPDTQGAVPILMWSHSVDDPEPRQFWQLAYKTDVNGLFLRAEANGFFGEQWQIVTGSGWKLFSGWWSREDAARAAAAIARVLPYIDWMSADSDALTPRSKKALAAVLRRYSHVGVREDQPEPEPLTAEQAAEPLKEEPATTGAAEGTK